MCKEFFVSFGKDTLPGTFNFAFGLVVNKGKSGYARGENNELFSVDSWHLKKYDLFFT